MTEYYFIGTFIPKLQLGMPPEITVEAYSTLLKENLTLNDYEEFKRLKLYFDIENIRLYWRGRPINHFGNFNEISLEEALLNEHGLPDYVYDYMNRYDSKEERLRNFAKLYAAFFNENRTGFLKKLFRQERILQLTLVALRAKKMGRSILHELQFENFDDECVASIVTQKDATNFEPLEEFLEVKTIYEKYQESPLELHQALADYRFRKIEEITGLQVFTLDRLLAYYFQLVLVHQLSHLKESKGIS